MADVNTAEYQISQADNIVVVVGHATRDGGEGRDRADVLLPRNQANLISESIAPLAEKYGKNLTVWMQGKSIFDISLFKDLPQVDAIVWSSFNGMYQGPAMAELLFNETVTLEDGRDVVANFSGKLPLTWYSNVDAQLGVAAAPENAVMDYTMTVDEGSKCGRTYMYYQADKAGCGAPDYVFGHGLSYSPFTYGAPTLSAASITPNDPVTVSVEVSNDVPNYPGKAVVEVYAKAPTGADGNERPLLQLKGFAKSDVVTGGAETVRVTLDAGDLWFWNDETHAKEFPTGAWTILAGPSSAAADLKAVTLTVTGTRTTGVDVVSVQPDGHELRLDTPDNRINAMLSVTKYDQTFWDLNDPALAVTYTSSNPAVATVDATGAVAPVAAGAVLITATATANGETKSATFPVVVVAGAPEVSSTFYDNNYTAGVNFADRKVLLEDATAAGVQLSANLAPSAAGATYSYQIAPMDTNTAGATVTPGGLIKATGEGFVRVTVTATSGEISTSESALIKIAPAVDKVPLERAVAAAEALDAADYTTSSWTAADLATVLASAQAVLDNPDAIQEQVDAARSAVSAAVALLEGRGDPAGLESLLVEAEGVVVDGYTAETVAVFEAAVAAADAVLAGAADMTQAELDAAVAALQAGIDQLTEKPVVDKTALEADVASAARLSNTDGKYTTASWDAMQVALAAAKTVLADPEATQAEVDAAAAAVRVAVDGLKVAPKAPTGGVVAASSGQAGVMSLLGVSAALLVGAVWWRRRQGQES